MFEEVRQARLARRLVGGADLVPDHVGDHRRAVVGNDDQLQSVRQREVGDRSARRLGGDVRTASKRGGDDRGDGHGRINDISFEWHDWEPCKPLR